MLKRIIAPTSLIKDGSEMQYLAAVSIAAEWVQRATTPMAFADLPTNPVEGWQIPITNSNTVVFRAVIAGGGGNHVLGYFDGADWRVAG